MRLELALPPSVLTFTYARDGGPLPWLLKVGTLRLQARVGQSGSAETASMEVTIDNSGRQAADVIDHPLRARATVYDDDDSIFFDGVVSFVEYLRIITLTIQA